MVCLASSDDPWPLPAPSDAPLHLHSLIRAAVILPLLFGGATESPVAAQQVGAEVSEHQLLRPGDVIRVRIWREPDMSGEFPVDALGLLVLPRVGEYRVLHETAESLRSRLLTDYQRYLRNPSIEITVLRRVRITGAVNDPGLHLVDPTYTVADALALAGGATPIGNPNKIRIIRDGEQLAVDVRQNTLIIESPIRSGDQIYVPERSWVSRNAGVVAAVITGTVSLIIAFSR